MIRTILQHSIIFFLCLFAMQSSKGQACSSLNLTLKADIGSACSTMVMTMMHDATGKDYLYVANKEAGLKIYDISNPSSPVLKKTLPTTLFDTLDVMSLTQQGSYVYLAIGNHFNNTQASGIAIVKVDTPSNAWVTGYWELPSSTGGAGAVAVEGNYAYLGCMGNGLVVLDVADKHNISFISRFSPNINYPTPSPNPSLYNARGMVVKDSIVYLCFDAGGIRIINCSNPSKPMETGRYSNPALNGKPRAYNNCQLDDTVLYVGFDYCGVEVLSVKDTARIKSIGWWNPYNCPANNWFTSAVHANELQLDKDCKLLFVADGKSDMHVLDVSDPTKPDSCNIYGGVSNNLGTWGVSLYGNQAYLSYICSVVPFSSNWTGVKILSFSGCNTGMKKPFPTLSLQIQPNPAKDILGISIKNTYLNDGGIKISIFNISGDVVLKKTLTQQYNEVDLGHIPSGVYVLVGEHYGVVFAQKFVKE